MKNGEEKLTEKDSKKTATKKKNVTGKTKAAKVTASKATTGRTSTRKTAAKSTKKESTKVEKSVDFDAEVEKVDKPVAVNTLDKEAIEVKEEKEEEEVTHIVDFIKLFRNVKQENNIGKDFKVKFNTNIPDLVIKMLKLESHITEKDINTTKYPVTDNYYSLDIYYEKELTEGDKKLLENQIENLKSSIARRQKLLSNEGYLTKAPKELVDGEREKLKEEENLLEKLLKN